MYKIKDYREFIPAPFESVITITADFELAWAWQFDKFSSVNNARRKAKLARENIITILGLCEKYDIPISWATVGHLFLSECSKIDGVSHPEIKQLGNFQNDHWKFSENNWFINDPHSNWEEDPEWYAPDLVKKIISGNAGHEIGCHTFSHIDCSDEICSPEVFESEIEACKNGAKRFGLNITSFVHPGHTIGHLDELAGLGFTSFQTDPGNILGYPEIHDNGLWEFKRTFEFVYNKEFSVKYNIHRYREIINRAVKNNSVCNFWFHPSVDPEFIRKILPSIFSYINELKGDILVTTPSRLINLITGDKE